MINLLLFLIFWLHAAPIRLAQTATRRLLPTQPLRFQGLLRLLHVGCDTDNVACEGDAIAEDVENVVYDVGGYGFLVDEEGYLLELGEDLHLAFGLPFEHEGGADVRHLHSAHAFVQFE